MAAGRLVLLLILAGTIVRLWLAGATGLGYDESYMVGNAREFALGYVDHPPLHVWIAGLAMRLFGSEAPIVVRLPFVLLFAGSTWLMYQLAGRMFGVHAGLWAATALTLAPVFSVSFGTFVLPDGPAVFFLLAAALFLARILFHKPAPASPTLWWIVVGILAGLAMLSKFNAAFFPLGVFAYLVTAERRHLATPGPWLAALAALIVLSPALIWNVEHDWIGIAFQAGRVGGSGLRLDRFALQVGGELLYLTPWLAVPFAISLWRALVRGPGEARGWLLVLVAIGPIALFTIVTLWSRGLPHWAMPGWLFAIPLFGRDTAALVATRPRFARRYMAATAAVFVVLFGAFMVQATRGGLVPQAAIAANPGVDPTTDLIDWTELKPSLAGHDLIAAPDWMIAGKASYAAGPAVTALCLCKMPLQFAFRTDQAAWAGHDAVVIMRAGDEDRMAAYFDALEPLPPVTITRAGLPILTLALKLGKSLHFPAK